MKTNILIKNLLCIVLLWPALGAAIEFNQALQSELIYIQSQKAALERQKEKLKATYQEQKRIAKQNAERLQKEIVTLTLENDQRHEQLVRLEKQKKDFDRRGSLIASTTKRALKSLAANRQALSLVAPDRTASLETKENQSRLEAFEALFQQARLQLKSSSQKEQLQTSFFDEEENLREATVTRVGRFAAMATDETDAKAAHLLLAPSGLGPLKVIERSKQAAQFFIFDNLEQVSVVQKPGGVMESLAQLAPLGFLGLVLLVVSGLFVVLVRI